MDPGTTDPTSLEWRIYRWLHVIGVTIQGGFFGSVVLSDLMLSGIHGSRNGAALGEYFCGLMLAWVFNFIAIMAYYQAVGRAGRSIFLWHFGILAFVAILFFCLPAVNQVRE